MLFYSITDLTSCSLLQQAHYALVCVWFIVLAVTLTEFCLAQLRRLDRSPRHVRLIYFVWLVVATTAYAFIVSRPFATVHDVEDAGVLLVLHVLRFNAVTWLAIEINLELLKNFAHLIARVSASYSLLTSPSSSSAVSASAALTADAPDASSPTPGSTLGTPDAKHATAKSAAQRLKTIATSVFRPIGIAHGLIHVVFLVIVPLSLGVTSTPLYFLEIFFRVVWVTHSLVTLLQALTLAYVTIRLRNIIHWLTTNVFVPKFEQQSKDSKGETADSANGDHQLSSTSGENTGSTTSKGLSPQIKQGIKDLRALENRMRLGARTNVIIALVIFPFFLTASIIGMQWWYANPTIFILIFSARIWHIIASQTLILPLTFLLYYRPHPFSSFSITTTHPNSESSTSQTGTGTV